MFKRHTGIPISIHRCVFVNRGLVVPQMMLQLKKKVQTCIDGNPFNTALALSLLRELGVEPPAAPAPAPRAAAPKASAAAKAAARPAASLDPDLVTFSLCFVQCSLCYYHFGLTRWCTLSHHLICMPQLGSSCQADLDNDDDGLTDDPEAAALLAELGVPVKAAAPKAVVAAASSGAAVAVAPAAVVSPQVHTEPSLINIELRCCLILGSKNCVFVFLNFHSFVFNFFSLLFF
jgi:hypothetical protein